MWARGPCLCVQLPSLSILQWLWRWLPEPWLIQGMLMPLADCRCFSASLHVWALVASDQTVTASCFACLRVQIWSIMSWSVCNCLANIKAFYWLWVPQCIFAYMISNGQWSFLHSKLHHMSQGTLNWACSWYVCNNNCLATNKACTVHQHAHDSCQTSDVVTASFWS